MTRRLPILAAVSLAIAVPGIAHAQTNATPGMQVKDAAGGTVGSVARLENDLVVVKTDRFEIPLPGQSFTKDGDVLLFGMTQAELNAEWEKRVAASEASLAVGSAVTGASGAHVGTIAAIDETSVTIELEGGQKIQLPRSGIAGSPQGAVIGFTAEELKAKIDG